jgi:hypothetical protein
VDGALLLLLPAADDIMGNERQKKGGGEKEEQDGERRRGGGATIITIIPYCNFCCQHQAAHQLCGAVHGVTEWSWLLLLLLRGFAAHLSSKLSSISPLRPLLFHLINHHSSSSITSLRGKDEAKIP